MIDFGWTELVMIMAVAVLVIGPKELPALMLGLGRIVRRLTYVKFALTQQFEDFMNQADMKDIGRGVNFEAPKEHEAAHFDEVAEDEDPDYYIPPDPDDVVEDDEDELEVEEVLEGKRDE